MDDRSEIDAIQNSRIVEHKTRRRGRDVHTRDEEWIRDDTDISVSKAMWMPSGE